MAKRKYKPTELDKKIYEAYHNPSINLRLDRVCAMFMMNKEQILTIVKQYDEYISASSTEVRDSGK